MSRLTDLIAQAKAKDPQLGADLDLRDARAPETQTVALDDLVVVAEFRDTIYPGLVSTGRVQRGGDKPHHTVINGENYHVLKALTYTPCRAVCGVKVRWRSMDMKSAVAA